MPEPAVIDLGDVSQEPEVVGRPEGVRRRPLLAAAVIMAAPIVLGGSAATPELTGIRIPALTDGFLTVDDQCVFTMKVAEDRPTLQVTIAAYLLVDGSRLWQVDVPSSVLLPTRFAVADGLLLLMGDADTGGNGLAALDARTGKLLWTGNGQVTGRAPTRAGTPGRVLLRENGEGSARPLAVRGVDSRTGERVWSHLPPAGAQIMISTRAATWETTAVVTGLPSGRAEVRDPGTGQVIATAAVRKPAPRPYDTVNPWIQSVNDLLLVWSVDWSTLTAYGLPDLGLRWSVPWEEGLSDWYVPFADVSGVLGLQSPAGRFRALDSRTGRLLWEQKWSQLQPLGPLLWGYRDDRMSDIDWPVFLVDPVTGRQRAELGPWSTIGQWSEEAGALLTRRDHGSGRVRVALLEPGATDLRLLGVLPEDTRTCMASGNRLVCNQAGSTIGVWRFR